MDGHHDCEEEHVLFPDVPREHYDYTRGHPSDGWRSQHAQLWGAFVWCTRPHFANLSEYVAQPIGLSCVLLLFGCFVLHSVGRIMVLVRPLCEQANNMQSSSSVLTMSSAGLAHGSFCESTRSTLLSSLMNQVLRVLAGIH